MERARARVRFCLLFVVILAVVLGLLYFGGYQGKKTVKEEGTLVRQEDDRWAQKKRQFI